MNEQPHKSWTKNFYGAILLVVGLNRINKCVGFLS